MTEIRAMSRFLGPRNPNMATKITLTFSILNKSKMDTSNITNIFNWLYLTIGDTVTILSSRIRFSGPRNRYMTTKITFTFSTLKKFKMDTTYNIFNIVIVGDNSYNSGVLGEGTLCVVLI